MDRKRRLTGTSNDEEASQRRPSALTRPGSSSNNRPLPMLPHGDQYNSPGAPGSTRDNAIDLVSSPPFHESSVGSSRRPSHILSTTSSHSGQNPIEYTLPQWQPDTEVTHCPICGTQFSFWYRKHHCRKCGRVVCSSCSPHRITIPRQYIVRPPEPTEPTPFERASSHNRHSSQSSHSSHLLDITSDDARDSSIAGYSDDHHPLNPALGGGEEVRLCNPCVPDPNPDPPVTYGAVRASFDRLVDPNWGTTLPPLPTSHPLHRPHRSLSGTQISSSRTAGDRDFYGYRHRSNLSTNFSSNQPGQSSSHHLYSSRYTLPHDFNQSSSPPLSSSARDAPHFFSTHQSGPASSTFRSSYSGPSRTRPDRVRSLIGPERPRYPPPNLVPVDERDICPICSMQLPPRGSDGNEDDREAHIRECIQTSSRTGRSPPGSSPPPQSPHPMRMLSFTATEKDCVNEDSTPQECTICMEEYEVGDRLARLECLCKFHKLCIVEWFERKRECPVHKFS
ncbi:FYVE zinc finger-domain-containing protein [Talaromyces proteolyticus]|uniref:RING-type E3 ubiquitin transferase n=1 Tax=Talaromyces proteolyticus TaxID=1131652 RepID=A0AAD4KFN9_9EURO|nr:FYVE zinc finger-domain-containing protein [Talaromyces proteolyticus]KAH8690038.1 FYVE zinc finger-domain-containing protein [Talaromyces proteolyticus]